MIIKIKWLDFYRENEINAATKNTCPKATKLKRLFR